MTDETELNTCNTAWVRGAKTKMGHAILTPEHLVFFDTKFMPGAAGGLIGSAVAGHLQKRHEEGGPLLVIDVSSITGVARQKKMLSKDRVEISTTGDTYVFSDGWKAWSPILRGLLSDSGRTVTDNAPDSWTTG
jgi:hypothetical protein